MLFTDDDWITADNLNDEDAKTSDIADAEGIDIPTQITRAIDECGAVLLNDLKAFSTWPSVNGLTPAHMMALMNAGGRTNPPTRLCLQNLVIGSTDGQMRSPIEMWVLNTALLRVFRAALNNNVIDKYLARVEYIEKELRNKWYARVFNDGLPFVYLPLSRPAASRDFWATGTWGNSNLTGTGNTGPAAGSWDVAITYVDQSSQSPNYVSYSAIPNNVDGTGQDSTGNAESAPSDTATITTTVNQLIQVSIASLYPPLGRAPSEVMASITPRAATGWNVYCGPQDTPLWLMNAAPIPIRTAQYTFSPASTPLAPIGTGQRRDDKMIMVRRSGRI
jgi:hypothetical protein